MGRMCRDPEVRQTYLERDTFKSAKCSIDISSPKVCRGTTKDQGPHSVPSADSSWLPCILHSEPACCSAILNF